MSVIKKYEVERQFIKKILRLLSCLCDKMEFDKELNKRHLYQAVELSELYMKEVFFSKEQALSEVYNRSSSHSKNEKQLIELVTVRGRMRSYLRKINAFKTEKEPVDQEKLLDLATNIRNYIIASLKYVYIVDKKSRPKQVRQKKRWEHLLRKPDLKPTASFGTYKKQSAWMNTFNDLQKIYQS